MRASIDTQFRALTDKPAQMSQIDMVSWAHLTPPRINFYVSVTEL